MLFRSPQPAALSGVDGRPATVRRHYLRVTAEPHPGLDRRIDSLVRRAGLSVQNRASRGAGDTVDLGYIVSDSTGATVDIVRHDVLRLARVHAALVLGVHE